MDQAEEQTEAMEAAEEHNERVVENLNHITVALKSMPKIAKGVPYCDFLLSDSSFTKEFGDEPDRWITELTNRIKNANKVATEGSNADEEMAAFIVAYGYGVILGILIFRIIQRTFKRASARLAAVDAKTVSEEVLSKRNKDALTVQHHKSTMNFLKQNAKKMIDMANNPLPAKLEDLRKLAIESEGQLERVKAGLDETWHGFHKPTLAKRGWKIGDFQQAIRDTTQVLDQTYGILIRQPKHVLSKRIVNPDERAIAKEKIKLAKRFVRSYMRTLHRVVLGVVTPL